MKFFYKMFLGMTVILAVALGMIEYVTLSYSLEHAVKREQDSALSQHQMIKYSIETVILNMKSEDVDKELTDMMSQSAKSIVGDEGGMYLADDDGKRIYANSCNYEQKAIRSSWTPFFLHFLVENGCSPDSFEGEARYRNFPGRRKPIAGDKTHNVRFRGAGESHPQNRSQTSDWHCW